MLAPYRTAPEMPEAVPGAGGRAARPPSQLSSFLEIPQQDYYYGSTTMLDWVNRHGDDRTRLLAMAFLADAPSPPGAAPTPCTGDASAILRPQDLLSISPSLHLSSPRR